MGFALKQARSWFAERKAGIPKADRDFIVQSGSESVAVEREFRAWRSGLERARGAWEKKAGRDKKGAWLTGSALSGAQDWLAKRSEDIEEADRTFIMQSRQAARRRNFRVAAHVGALVAAMAVGVAAWWNRAWLKERAKEAAYAWANAAPLNAPQERALKAGDPFKECRDCPEMIAVPAGEFKMGAPETEAGRFANEGPQHDVAIARPFAVSKFDVTFDDWDACVSIGGCPGVDNSTYGRETKPVINVSWVQAQQYVAWLARMTGKPYRLLTEAEWEYAARAGATTAYSWGEDIGAGNANCMGCGSKWDKVETSPVGSFPPNAFGLYDMAGDVWQWVQDCNHQDYQNAPTDGSAWTEGDCNEHNVRGGSWLAKPPFLRSTFGGEFPTDERNSDLGFRVARALAP